MLIPHRCQWRKHCWARLPVSKKLHWLIRFGAISVRSIAKNVSAGTHPGCRAELLDIFDFLVLRGDGRNALKKPYQALLTETTAKKFFGNNDPIGKVFIIKI